jgi:hypothetical protein
VCSPAVLAGSRLRRLFPDVYVSADVEPDLAVRSFAAAVLVGVEALAHRFVFPPHEAIRCAYGHPGRRGAARLPRVVKLAHSDPESPMETRIRLAIVLDGLPAPQLQVPVGPYRLDVAYPEMRLGIEYDGREHLDQRRAVRRAMIVANGTPERSTAS